jgi:hypothetical protein
MRYFLAACFIGLGLGVVRAPSHREQPDRSIVNTKINPS